jgi:hypothetical protein
MFKKRTETWAYHLSGPTPAEIQDLAHMKVGKKLPAAALRSRAFSELCWY